MNKLRNQYLYHFKGTILSQQPRKVPTNPQPFYQLSIVSKDSTLTKIFVFKNKATEPIWKAISENNCSGQKYSFYCKNYRGYYQLIDWEPLNGHHKAKLCQYQASHCQKIANYQHTLKLGVVAIEKQWVCGNCKQILQNNHEPTK
jgi:hypothetical protein